MSLIGLFASDDHSGPAALVDAVRPNGKIWEAPRKVVGEGWPPPKRSMTYTFLEVEILSQDCFLPCNFLFLFTLLIWYVKNYTLF